MIAGEEVVVVEGVVVGEVSVDVVAVVLEEEVQAAEGVAEEEAAVQANLLARSAPDQISISATLTFYTLVLYFVRLYIIH